NYRIETSPDGSAWTTALVGSFTTANRHQLNLVTPTAGASGVRYVRLTMVLSMGGAFKDLTEFAVYGTAAGTDTTAPETTIAPGGPPFTFTSSEPNSTFECRIDAEAFASCTSPFSPGSLPD